MVEGGTLTHAASSLLSDPTNYAAQAERILADVRKRGPGGSGTFQDLIAAIEQLRQLRGSSLMTLYEHARSNMNSEDEREREVALVLIGTLRAILARRLAEDIPLTKTEQRIYEKIRVHR